MKVGITGTRSGMTHIQFRMVRAFLTHVVQSSNLPLEFHHGDCVGVDVEAAAIAKELGFKIICHPPIKDELRGFFTSDETREPLSYFARNRNIVDETDVLIACPYQNTHQSHGGTWYTFDYAYKKQKPIELYLPGITT